MSRDKCRRHVIRINQSEHSIRYRGTREITNQCAAGLTSSQSEHSIDASRTNENTRFLGGLIATRLIAIS